MKDNHAQIDIKDVRIAFVFVAILASLVVGISQLCGITSDKEKMSQNCYNENYGYCSESLCWDYDKDVEEKDILCGELATLFCTDKISELDFKDSVDELSTDFVEN